MIRFTAVRQQVIEAGKAMKASALVVGTWGNISARVPEEALMAITPTGVDYDAITPEGIVIMDFDGNIIDGNMKPSIEFQLHSAIYKAREDVHAIMHTHSTYTTAFAIARKPIPAAAEDLVQIVGGDVRVGAYHLPGSAELGAEVVKAMEGRNAALMASHGCIAAGSTMKETLKIVQVVEKSAQAALFAQLLGGVVPLDQEDIDFMRDFYLNRYGQR